MSRKRKRRQPEQIVKLLSELGDAVGRQIGGKGVPEIRDHRVNLAALEQTIQQ